MSKKAIVFSLVVLFFLGLGYLIFNKVYLSNSSVDQYRFVFIIFLIIIGGNYFIFANKLKSDTANSGKKSEHRKNSFYHKSIFLIILLSILVIAVYNFNNIGFLDTDEIRLFYDAKLITEGGIPFVDFEARSPPLIYLLAGIILIFGNSVYNFYILSILLTLISSILIYILGSKLFSKEAGLFSMFLYGFSPLIFNLLYVKTQSFEIPLILGAAILYLKFLEKRSVKLVLLSIFLINIAVLIRESTLFILPFLFIIDFFESKDTKNNMLKRIVMFSLGSFVGYAIFHIGMILAFPESSRWLIGPLPAPEYYQSQSFERLKHIVPYLSVFTTVLLSSFLFYFISVLGDIKRSRTLQRQLALFVSLLVLIAFYVYSYFTLGFWPEYLIETLPMTSLILGPALLFLNWGYKEKIVACLCVLITVLLIMVSSYNSYVYYKEYKGVYNIEGVENVSNYLRETSHTNTTLFAGSPIYSYVSDVSSILPLSHSYYDQKSVEIITDYLKNNPPTYIIEDPYLKDYLAYNEFKNFFKTNYSLEKEYSGIKFKKKYNYKVYRYQNQTLLPLIRK